MAGLGCLCCPGHCQVILAPSLRLLNTSDSASSYLGLKHSSSILAWIDSCNPVVFSESQAILAKSSFFTLNGMATSYFSYRIAGSLEQIVGILELKPEIASDWNSIIFCFFLSCMYYLRCIFRLRVKTAAGAQSTSPFFIFFNSSSVWRLGRMETSDVWWRGHCRHVVARGTYQVRQQKHHWFLPSNDWECCRSPLLAAPRPTTRSRRWGQTGETTENRSADHTTPWCRCLNIFYSACKYFCQAWDERLLRRAASGRAATGGGPAAAATAAAPSTWTMWSSRWAAPAQTWEPCLTNVWQCCSVIQYSENATSP